MININTCSALLLQRAKGVGPTAAGRIVDARPLLSWEDVAAVKGVGPRAVEALKAVQLVVGKPSQDDQRMLDRRRRAAERAKARAEDALFDRQVREQLALVDKALGEYGEPIRVVRAGDEWFHVDGLDWSGPKPTARVGELRTVVGSRLVVISRVGSNPWRVDGVSGLTFTSANAAARWVAARGVRA